MRLSWKTYLVGALVVIAAYLFTPSGTVLQTVVKVAVGWTAAACIVLGVRRNRPGGAAIWYWFAAGIFSNVTGILVEAIATRVYGVDAYPTVADVFWLALYPALIVGMTLMIRRRSAERDWASIVDTCTISTGLGLLCWVFVIHPATSDPALTLLGRAVVGAYPVGDLVVLAMMVRLILGGGSRNTSFRLMIGSLLLFLGGDVGWVVVNQIGVAPGRLLGNILDAVFLVAFALFGVAALHPSMGEDRRSSLPCEPAAQPGTARAAHQRVPHCSRCAAHPGHRWSRHRRAGDRGRLDRVVPARRDPDGAAASSGRGAGRAAARARRGGRAHRPAEPTGLDRRAQLHPRTRPPRRRRPDRGHDRPGSLQAVQRRARPSGRRPAAQGRGRPVERAAARS